MGNGNVDCEYKGLWTLYIYIYIFFFPPQNQGRTATRGRMHAFRILPTHTHTHAEPQFILLIRTNTSHGFVTQSLAADIRQFISIGRGRFARDVADSRSDAFASSMTARRSHAKLYIANPTFFLHAILDPTMSASQSQRLFIKMLNALSHCSKLSLSIHRL